MLERQELCSILRGGTGEIEYGRGVRFCRHVGRGWIVRLHDGEMLHADVLIGSCEFYAIRVD